MCGGRQRRVTGMTRPQHAPSGHSSPPFANGMLMTPLNETHDPSLRSWVEAANAEGTDFPIQNLPFGVFRRAGSTEVFRGGVAIGDQILDLAAVRIARAIRSTAAANGLKAASSGPTLNAFMA